jgi:hypothetical protein
MNAWVKVGAVCYPHEEPGDLLTITKVARRSKSNFAVEYVWHTEHLNGEEPVRGFRSMETFIHNFSPVCANCKRPHTYHLEDGTCLFAAGRMR